LEYISVIAVEMPHDLGTSLDATAVIDLEPAAKRRCDGVLPGFRQGRYLLGGVRKQARFDKAGGMQTIVRLPNGARVFSIGRAFSNRHEQSTDLIGCILGLYRR
jgi:hypothetical protein